MRHTWSLAANCIGVDPNVFFIDTKDLRLVREAKKYCDYCVCRRECLTWAYETGQQGIWGGTTDSERPFAYFLLKTVTIVPREKIIAASVRPANTYDFLPSRKRDVPSHRLDEQDHRDDQIDIPFPYNRNPQAYRLAVAIRILRLERERVLAASRVSA